MWCKKSFFVVSFIISMLVMSVCSAQTFYSADKRASLVAPDEYVLATENDGMTIIKIQNNQKDIVITFYVNTTRFDYSTLKDVPTEGRKEISEALLDNMVYNFTQKGYIVSLHKPKIDDHFIMIALDCTKNNKDYILSANSFIKDNYLFGLSIWAPARENLDEAFAIMGTLTIDGVPLENWIP